MHTAKTAAPVRGFERLGGENPAVAMTTTLTGVSFLGLVLILVRRGRAVLGPRQPSHSVVMMSAQPLRTTRSARRDISSGARVPTAILLFLPPATPAAPTCPAGSTPSPASATWGPRRFLVPPERSTSLFRCVDLCEEHGGTPACIGSAEENDLLTVDLAAADGLWLGLYQNETGLGTAGGWRRCVADDAPSFSNWYEGQPNDYHGYKQDCAWVDARTGQWRALACDGGVHLDPLPWRLNELSCLCARGNASAAFADDLEVLEATQDYNQRLLSARTATAFAAAIAVAVLPTLLLLGWTGWRWLRRGADAQSSVGVQGAATSPSPPSRSIAVARLSTRRLSAAAASFAGVKGKLHAVRESAAGRRLRVSFAMGQAGWAILVIGSIPLVMFNTGLSIGAAVGSVRRWQVLAPLGACLLGLALFPTDARAIRVVIATLIVVFTGLGALSIAPAHAGDLPDAVGFQGAALFFAHACALTSTLRCRSHRAMQPRPALRWLWTVSRFSFLIIGVLLAGLNIADYVQGGNNFDYWANAASSVDCLLCAALATPRNRGRLHRRLGRLGGRGTEAEEAAAVVMALVGGNDPDAALERASKLLRCLPASRLLAADLAGSGLGLSTSATELAAKTVPATMGEVTAFLSHSWRDEDEAPGRKHSVVSRWARRRQETTGKEPTLWLVNLAQ